MILHFAKAVSSTMSGEELYDTACHLITAIKQNVSSYDEADFILREALFNYYLGCEQFSDAAQILCGANLESTTRVFTDKEKADIFVRCAGMATIFCFLYWFVLLANRDLSGG